MPSYKEAKLIFFRMQLDVYTYTHKSMYFSRHNNYKQYYKEFARVPVFQNLNETNKPVVFFFLHPLIIEDANLNDLNLSFHSETYMCYKE